MNLPDRAELKGIVEKTGIVIATGSSLVLVGCGPSQSASLAESTITPISAPDARPTTLPPTATATLVPIPTATLTFTPTATETPTPSPTPTETPKPIEKSPLTVYGAYYGSFMDSHGAPGAIAVASIPEVVNKDYILLYWVQGRSDGLHGAAFFRFAALETLSIAGKTFVAQTRPDDVSRVGLERLEVTLSNGVLSGMVADNRDHQQEFRASLSGTGKNAVIYAIKSAKAIGFELGYVNPNQVNIDELAVLGSIDPSRLP